MKIAVVSASREGSAADMLKGIITETLAELGEDIVNIALANMHVPFYKADGEDDDNAAVRGAIFEMMSADGVVFIVPQMLRGMSALMKAFLEHTAMAQFRQALLDKNCMVVCVPLGSNDGARETLEGMSRIIGALGGNDAVRIWMPQYVLLAGDADARLIAEKKTEDYYRILRQERKFYPMDVIPQVKEDDAAADKPDADFASAGDIQQHVIKRVLTEDQEQDVESITRFFAEKLENPAKPEKTAQAAVSKPRNKTCKQLTAGLPHYFNPQLAAGIRTVIALNVTGEEVFNGVISIENSKCSYMDGDATDPEMLINIDSKVWTDVLTGKVSAQKAFMIGQLKVRGNFLLLTKMDQLFSKMEV